MGCLPHGGKQSFLPRSAITSCCLLILADIFSFLVHVNKTGFLAFMEALSRIVLLQSLWRMQRQRKRYVAHTELAESATLVQSVVRMWIAVKSYHHAREIRAAVAIQSSFRRHAAESCLLDRLSDVILCQAAVRRYLTRERTAAMRCVRDNMASLMIQTNFRRHQARADFLFTVSDVALCQTVVRRYLAMEHTATLRCIRDNKAAMIIQANFRRYQARTDFLFIVSDVVLCQAAVRRFSASSRVASLRDVRDTKASSMIQTIFR